MKSLKISIIVSVMLSLAIAPNVFAENQFEQMTIKGTGQNLGDEAFIFIKFGSSEIDQSFSRATAIPTLEEGYVTIFDDVIEFTNAKVKNYGNSSFSIKQISEESNIVIYGTEKNETVDMVAYVFSAGGALKMNFEASIEDNEKPQAESFVSEVNMSMLVQHDVRTNWKDTYDIALKLFDLEQNPKPLFDKSNGAIEDVEITVSLTHQKSSTIITTLSGKTSDKGYWEGEFYITENIIPGGVYFVDISAEYLGNKISERYETIVVPGSSDSDD